MNSNPKPFESAQPRSDAGQAELICAEFARAWRREAGPQIEACLERVLPQERRLLFCELLEIELHARQQRGDFPAEEEYLARFPDQQPAIAALFAKWVRKRLGDYDILREIGHGGMGIVYQAQHRLLDQVVAIKLLPESALGDLQAVRRFQREMLSIGRMNHPNIVRALNAGEERGVPYLVMEFLEGLDFRELVNAAGRLSPEAACELIRQAAVGLQHIHERGLVHRDIKPANLILADDAVVKILDLGLVRLDTLPAARELTQPGTPMGTVDYMAPEQWVDPSAVDIRADIYALGCTLYFLLTGQPPSAMAARRTPFPRRSRSSPTHPSVASLRRDCPPDLDKILELMLAEEPDERFDTPGEVAEALGVFADPAALAPLVGVGKKTSAPAQRTSAAGSPVPTTTWATAAKRSPPAGPGRGRWKPARRRVGWGFEAVGAVGLALAVLAVWLALRFWGGGALSSALLGPAAHAPPPLAAELAALPGLNGHWWFDETPWLLPHVRDHLARNAASAAGKAEPESPHLPETPWLWEADVRAVQDRLLERVRPALDQLASPASTLVAELLALSQEDLGDERLAARLQTAAQRFQAAKDASGSWTALDRHTQALLQHKIAAIHSDLELARQAAATYDAALAAYGDDEDAIGAALHARCLVDSGQLYALVFRDYPEARRRYRAARPLTGTARLALAETWFSEGIASAAANPQAADKYTEAGAALTQAQQIIQQAEPALANHPLLAHIHERHAWILMDQWNVLGASQEFEQARNIRFDNYWKSKNEFAQIFAFHNAHGLAMAERYCGDARIARAKYELVIGEVEKALTRADAQPDRPGWQRLRRDLRERWSNSCERRADCELYGGAASGAPVDLQEAARLYAIARDQADDPAVQIAMSCKRSIVLALDGHVAEARQEISGTRAAQQTVIGVHEERVRLLRKLAEATLLLRDEDVTSGLTALRAFLRAFDLDANYPDRHRRETQELQLLAAELLIATQRAHQLDEAAVADVSFLDRLIAAFPYRDQMLPYLRRYYDLAIEATAASDPQRAAGYLLAARDQRPQPDTMMLLFHFVPARKAAVKESGQAPRDEPDSPGVRGARSEPVPFFHSRGRAILHQAESSVCFALDYDRDQVRQAAASGQTLSLPPELVRRVTAELDAGRDVVLYWSDVRCWSRAEDALTRQDWPFGSQLDLAQLVEPATGKLSAERPETSSAQAELPMARRSALDSSTQDSRQ